MGRGARPTEPDGRRNSRLSLYADGACLVGFVDTRLFSTATTGLLHGCGGPRCDTSAGQRRLGGPGKRLPQGGLSTRGSPPAWRSSAKWPRCGAGAQERAVCAGQVGRPDDRSHQASAQAGHIRRRTSPALRSGTGPPDRAKAVRTAQAGRSGKTEATRKTSERVHRDRNERTRKAPEPTRSGAFLVACPKKESLTGRSPSASRSRTWTSRRTGPRLGVAGRLSWLPLRRRRGRSSGRTIRRSRRSG
ncbi:hypothetical protein SAMN04489732_1575 [Amycolatopsis saalfeldensis]|uniref:Uncharacterized protein n=1 Tax=Amycolatopsis saalfeldensis TaxID=394193 RepID=A0A1H8YQT6_9PSEU|nr:hypothetical protein SAMN04489732_1575 [Amycolatopsis saalfeldensis]